MPDIGKVQAAGKTAGELQNADPRPLRAQVLHPPHRHREHRGPRLLCQWRSQSPRTSSFMSAKPLSPKPSRPPAISPTLPITKTSGSSASMATAPRSMWTGCETAGLKTRRFIPAIKSLFIAASGNDSTQHPFRQKGGRPDGCPPFSFSHRTRSGKRTATGRRLVFGTGTSLWNFNANQGSRSQPRQTPWLRSTASPFKPPCSATVISSPWVPFNFNSGLAPPASVACVPANFLCGRLWLPSPSHNSP